MAIDATLKPVPHDFHDEMIVVDRFLELSSSRA